MPQKEWRLDTRVAHAGVGSDPAYGSVTTPIFQTVTYQHTSDGFGPFDYSRTDNPTRHSLAQSITELEGGSGTSVFGSGMAAITALAHLLKSGDHVVLTQDAYGGTYRLFQDTFQKFGVTATYVDTRDPDQVASALTPHTRLLFIETPSNPLLQISDLKILTELAHAQGAWIAVDNTFMTFLRQRPFDFGADFVVYSATKYLAGHNDVVAGLVISRSPELAEEIAVICNASGGILAPWDSWLLLRGLKTLDLRLDRQEQNAIALAQFLAQHPKIAATYYPGLSQHPGGLLHLRQATGPGAMISFRLHDPESVGPMMDELHCIIPAVSLGGVESLITHPFYETHRELPESVRMALGITPGLVRLSVGIENVADLEADLAQALHAIP